MNEPTETRNQECSAGSTRSFHELNAEILIQLGERVLGCIRSKEGDKAQQRLGFYHGLLVSHLKVAKPEVKDERKQAPETIQDQIWDLFSIPESERARRRSQSVQQA
ncbi:MAG: hypothetical protein ACTHMT_13360 [Verrucomicrobiota bacterium]